MNLTALFKALKFACVPTLSILILLFFGFFSITETLSFISSNQTSAVVIRIAAMILEFVLVYIMYTKYLEEEIINNPPIGGKEKNIHRTTYIRDIFYNCGDDYNFVCLDTESSDIKIVIRKPKN